MGSRPSPSDAGGFGRFVHQARIDRGEKVQQPSSPEAPLVQLQSADSALNPHCCVLCCRFDNMTDMKKLSDAELSRNLQIFHKSDRCYVRAPATPTCSPLCMAMILTPFSAVLLWAHTSGHQPV